MADREREGKAILVVDDDSATRTMLEFSLAKLGAQLYFAENGQVAIALLPTIVDAHSRVVIFSDVQMPVLDGPGLVKHVRGSENPDIAELPIVLNTGQSGDYERVREAVIDQAGGHRFEFFQKPVQRDVLLETLSRLLAEGEAGEDEIE